MVVVLRIYSSGCNHMGRLCVPVPSISGCLAVFTAGGKILKSIIAINSYICNTIRDNNSVSSLLALSCFHD